MKNFIVIILGLTALVSCRSDRDQTYLSVQLSPYTEDMDLIPEYFSIKALTYAQLMTGYEDFVRLYFGSGMQRENPAYWMLLDDLTGSATYMFEMKRDEESNVCTDTIRRNYRDDSEMISLVITHDLSSDEIRYIWLDENNERSSKAVIIPIDQPLRKGKMFPELVVETPDGDELSVKDLRGKTVVINWWQTTCAPCIEEMPGLNTLVEQYKDNPDIVFVAIVNNDKEQLAPFLQNTEFDYIHTLANDKAVELFGSAYPINIIVNPDGRISYYSKGGHAKKHIEIDRVLKRLTD